MTWLSYFVFVVLSGYGLAVILVEKKRQWPVRRFHLLLKRLLRKLHPRLPRMLSCTVCCSFWATLVVEIVFSLAYLVFQRQLPPFWGWPLTGFVTTGLTWTIMDALISLAAISDKKNG